MDKMLNITDLRRLFLSDLPIEGHYHAPEEIETLWHVIVNEIIRRRTFGRATRSYFLVSPAWKLTFYDTEQVRKYDAELSHLHYGLEKVAQERVREKENER
jgi:hypothetical protein